MTRPDAGTVEDRAAPPVEVDGPRLRGVIPFGVESRDLGGFREVMEPGCLTGADMGELVATVDHVGVPLGRYPGTLEVEERADGLHWSVELPGARADVREAVERGDLRSASWRMIVGRDRWEGTTRHVERVAELRDVAVVTTPAYGTNAPIEYRARPDVDIDAPTREEKPMPEENEDQQNVTPTPPPAGDAANATPAAPGGEATGGAATSTGGLRVESRSAETSAPTVESRVLDGLLAVRKGEVRSLELADVGQLAPPEMSTYLWDRIRPSSVAIRSGIRRISTNRATVEWPSLTADMTAAWTQEATLIPASDAVFGTLSASPSKLAARAVFSNEVADDSVPAAIGVLTAHIGRIMALKLDLAVFEGSGTLPEIKGLRNVAGTGSVSMGTNGATPADLDWLADAISTLEGASIPGPYVAVMNPRTWATLRKLRELTTGGNKYLLSEPPALDAPRQILGVPVYLSAQLSVTETQGTATNASSVYLYSVAPEMSPVLVDRQGVDAATIELDRSRLFDMDQSELRGKVRVDLLVPQPAAVVRVKGIKP